MKEINIKTKGMHCRSCELLVEQDLKGISAVSNVKADWKQQTVHVVFDETKTDIDQIGQRIQKLGFGNNTEAEAESTKESKGKSNYVEFGFALLIFILIYYLAYLFDIGESFTVGLSEFSISTALLVGLTAGVSTCMALVGGLILGLSAGYNQKHQNAGTISKLKPHVLFNLGRIAGFWILGGLLGLFGSLFSISAAFSGIFTILVALLMFIMGLKLTGIIPVLSNFQFALPKSVSSKIFGKGADSEGFSYRKATILGALTFLLPCGFTQMMQTFAVSTGDFWQASAIMGAFALGTVPGLFGIGAVTAFIKGRAGGILFRVTGLVLIAFALYNFSNGYNLSRSILTVQDKADLEKSTTSIQVAEPVELLTTYTLNEDIVPNQFKVKAGQKVRFVIDVKEDGQGCMSAIMIPGLFDDAKPLIKGRMVLEFTAVKKGVFPIT